MSSAALGADSLKIRELANLARWLLIESSEEAAMYISIGALILIIILLILIF